MNKGSILVGIPCRNAPLEKHPYPGSSIPWSYLESIEKAGGVAICIPTYGCSEILRSYFDIVDCLIFAGGEDVCPSYYEEEPSSKLREVCRKRDKTDTTLMNWALEKNIPILGICRGMQVLNIALGGSLHQDIHSIDVKYKDHPLEDWTSDAHSISLVGDTLLTNTLGMSGSTNVNSIHHQVIARLGKGLKVSATSDDGLVEAIEHEDPEKYIMAVQWHPEIMWQKDYPEWLNLFKGLVEVARKRK